MATLHQRPAHNAPHNHGGIGTGVPTTTTNQSHTQTQNQAQGNLCNHCHKWPKTPGHNFCSKTCANRGPTGSGNFNSNTRNNTSAATGNSNPIMNPNANSGMTTNGNGGTNRSHNNNQAGNNSNLCNFCRKKSKLPPHDFCGKTCATNAGAAPAPPPPYQAHATTGTGLSSGSAGSGGSQSIQTQTQNWGRGQGQPAGHGSANATRGSQNRRNGSGGNGAGVTPAPIDPVEITKMVVDQIPYLKSFIPQNSPLLNGIPSGQGASTNVANALGLNFASGSGGSGGAPISTGTTTTLHVLQVGSDTEDDEEAGECALAGCTNSRYIDMNGMKSSYCSQRHRQQAVASGMVDPCILCGLNPQGDGDYFCSRECRDEALNKAAGGSGAVDEDEDAQVKAGKQ